MCLLKSKHSCNNVVYLGAASEPPTADSSITGSPPPAARRVAEMEAQAAHSMAGMEEMRARCAAELAGLQLEFKRYQQQKAAEIGALEQRLVACLQLPFEGPLESLQGQAAAASRCAACVQRCSCYHSTHVHGTRPGSSCWHEHRMHAGLLARCRPLCSGQL
jgi:hypothetical protein